MHTVTYRHRTCVGRNVSNFPRESTNERRSFVQPRLHLSDGPYRLQSVTALLPLPSLILLGRLSLKWIPSATISRQLNKAHHSGTRIHPGIWSQPVSTFLFDSEVIHLFCATLVYVRPRVVNGNLTLLAQLERQRSIKRRSG